MKTKTIIMFAMLIACVVETMPSSPSEDELLDETPIDEHGLGLQAELHPFTTQYNPSVIDETHDKCCPTGSYVNCVDDVANSCSAGYSLTACYGCDFVNPSDYCSTSFQGNPWLWEGVGSLYLCTGLSWRISNGVMAHDHCSYNTPSKICTPQTDAGVCNYQDVGGNDFPNGCEDYGAIEAWTFDGAIGRMCCRADGSSPSGYYCIPREEDDACNDSPHTVSAYCMPCTDPPTWVDPDGSGAGNLLGGWDLKSSGSNEFAGSVYCGDGTNNSIHEADLPDWTGDECRKVEYVCRGTQVNAGTGAIQNDEC